MDMEKDYEFTDYGHAGEESPVEEFVPEFAEEIVVEEGEKTFLDKIKEIPKAVWVAAVAAVTAIIAIIVIVSLLGNTYKTPIKAIEKLWNCKRPSQYIDLTLAQMNGLAENEINEVYEILMKSDNVDEKMEEAELLFEDQIEDLKDEYGSNYKFSFEIVDKVELERENLKSFRESLRNVGEEIEEFVEETEDYDSDDWEDAADEIGLTRSQAKKLVSALKKLGKKFDSAKVSAGYEVSVVIKITGSELDEPEERESTFTVIKVDGRWVSTNAFAIVKMFDMF